MGYSQIVQANIYEDKLREYGPYGYCAMCGELNFKRCECEYVQTVDYINQDKKINYTKISNELAEYNTKKCESYTVYKTEKEMQLINNSFYEISDETKISDFLNGSLQFK